MIPLELPNQLLVIRTGITNSLNDFVSQLSQCDDIADRGAKRHLHGIYVKPSYRDGPGVEITPQDIDMSGLTA